MKDELDVPEVISEAMQQQAQEFANGDENSVTEKEESDSDMPVKRVTRNRGVNKQVFIDSVSEHSSNLQDDY